MDLVGLYLAAPFWWWVAAAVLFLAIEVATGTQTLLWPAAAAAVVAVLSATTLRLPVGGDLALFALLTIASALLARRFIRRPAEAPDINDPMHRLVGLHGEVVGGFDHGHGRVFVDGKEWAAEAEATGVPMVGDRIVVAGVMDSGRLHVRPG